jgi:4-oxalocrotonate tautomerase
MPIVTIKLVDQPTTTEQKQRLIKGVTELLHDVLVKDPDRIYVVIEDVPLENWGAGGISTAQRREAGMTGLCQCGQHDES